jgi:hypothetical protein
LADFELDLKLSTGQSHSTTSRGEITEGTFDGKPDSCKRHPQVLSYIVSLRIQVLVTHHVELVIPSAQYFVRMLDGRIDTQGTVTELQSRGLLDSIVLEAQAAEEPEVVTAEELAIVANTSETDNALPDDGTVKSKRPKKLVEDEARASGSVKWRVYKAYLQAT